MQQKTSIYYYLVAFPSFLPQPSWKTVTKEDKYNQAKKGKSQVWSAHTAVASSFKQKTKVRGSWLKNWGMKRL